MWQSESENKEQRRERRAESRESPYTPTSIPYWPAPLLSEPVSFLLALLTVTAVKSFQLEPFAGYDLFVGICLSQIMRLRLSHIAAGQLSCSLKKTSLKVVFRIFQHFDTHTAPIQGQLSTHFHCMMLILIEMSFSYPKMIVANDQNIVYWNK